MLARTRKIRRVIRSRPTEVRSDQIPEITLSSKARPRIICGRVGNTMGPVRDIVTDPEYLDVTVPPRAEFTHRTESGHTVCACVI